MLEGDELEGVEVEAGEPEAETQDPAEGSELAPDTAPEQEQKPDGETDDAEFSEGAKKRINKVINKQYAMRKSAEEEAAALRKEADELKQRLAQAQGLDQEPEVPPIPDQYDEDYEAKLTARDAAIERRAAWKREQEFILAQQQQVAQEAEQKRQETLMKAADSYAERAKVLNVDGGALQEASQAVAAFGVPDELVIELLADEDGPLLTQYLGSNLDVLDQLVRVPLHEAVRKIERDIRPKAQALRPKTSDAPPPAETLGGGGVAVDDLGGHKVTIE